LKISKGFSTCKAGTGLNQSSNYYMRIWKITFSGKKKRKLFFSPAEKVFFFSSLFLCFTFSIYSLEQSIEANVGYFYQRTEGNKNR
jgi:hypothetical protein